MKIYCNKLRTLVKPIVLWIRFPGWVSPPNLVSIGECILEDVTDGREGKEMCYCIDDNNEFVIFLKIFTKMIVRILSNPIVDLTWGVRTRALRLSHFFFLA